MYARRRTARDAENVMHHLKAGAVVALASAALLAASLPAGASAGPRHCPRTYTLFMFKRAADAVYSGTDNPPPGSYGHLWRYVRCQRKPADKPLARAYWKKDHDAWAQRRHPPDLGFDSPDIGDIPGVPRVFVVCVATKESSYTLNGNTYGIIPASGYSVEGAPLSVQKHAFAALYHSDGPRAWTTWEPPPPCPT